MTQRASSATTVPATTVPATTVPATAAIFERTTDRTLLLGMNTPQVDPAVLVGALADTDADAWFGPATGGGFWAIGLDHAGGDLVRGVHTSR